MKAKLNSIRLFPFQIIVFSIIFSFFSTKNINATDLKVSKIYSCDVIYNDGEFVFPEVDISNINYISAYKNEWNVKITIRDTYANIVYTSTINGVDLAPYSTITLSAANVYIPVNDYSDYSTSTITAVVNYAFDIDRTNDELNCMFFIRGKPLVAENPTPANGEDEVPIKIMLLRWFNPNQDQMNITTKAYISRMLGGKMIKPINEINVVDSVSFGEPIDSTLVGTDSLQLPFELEPSTTYAWKIDQTNDVGTTEGEVWYFTTEAVPLPEAPILQTPTNGSTEQETTLTLSWRQSEYDSSYTLEVATDQQFTNKIVDESNISDTSKEISSLNSITQYYWRVKAENSSGESPYSNVWSFTTKATGPAVSEIPDQTIAEGGSFTTIQLDDYVTDQDNLDSEITWSYSGNTELSVSIDGSRVATISIPNVDWNGSETVTFTATDPSSSTSNTQTTFTATAVNDAPIVSNIPNQTIAEGGNFAQIQLDDYVTDVDNTDDEITWSFSGNTDLTISVDGSRIATITTPNMAWNGSETVTFTATDQSSASANDQAIFTVTEVNDLPVVSNIPDQTIDEGISFATIQLDDYVIDSDNTDSEISWSYSGNTELAVSIDGNRVAIITVPNLDWFGSETITFKASDPSNQSDSTETLFTVNPINDVPVIEGLPSTIVISIDSSAVVNLWDYVSDVEDADSELMYGFMTTTDIVLAYNDENGELEISTNTNFSDEIELKIVISDTEEASAESSVTVQVEEVTGVFDHLPTETPDEFVLMQNYPNPYNPTTNIRFGIPEHSDIQLHIYNSLGELVQELLNQYMNSGYYEISWDASNLPSGIYLIRINAMGIETKKNFTQVKKAILLK